MKKKATFSDIAKVTGFSKTTISRYFNKPETITVKNRTIIRQALEELNYTENKVAKILANGHTELLGIILPNFYFPFYSQMVNQLISTYEQYEYKFIVFLSNNNTLTERKCIQELLAYNIEGLINFSHQLSSKELSKLGIPVIAVERESQYLSSVSTNSFIGARLAVKQFIQDKCDVFIHINVFDDPLSPTYERITGFEAACKEYSCEYEIIYRNFEYKFQQSVEIMREIFALLKQKYPNKKKGIFCANDMLACACLNAFHSSGALIPSEYEIIGFDNSPITEETIISLSTIAQDIDQMTANIMEMMMREIDRRRSRQGESTTIEHITVAPKMICRQTTSTGI